MIITNFMSMVTDTTATTMMNIITNVAGGAGTLLGSILAGLVGRHHAENLNAHIERGGLILWIRAWEPEDEALAINIVRKHGAVDVHSHACLVT